MVPIVICSVLSSIVALSWNYITMDPFAINAIFNSQNIIIVMISGIYFLSVIMLIISSIVTKERAVEIIAQIFSKKYLSNDSIFSKQQKEPLWLELVCCFVTWLVFAVTVILAINCYK